MVKIMLKIFKILLIIILLGLSFLVGTKYPQFGKFIDKSEINRQAGEQAEVIPDFVIEEQTPANEQSAIDEQVENIENVIDGNATGNSEVVNTIGAVNTTTTEATTIENSSN
jgi:hypothetical protein